MVAAAPVDQWVEAIVVVRGSRRVEHYIDGDLVNIGSSLALNLENPIFENLDSDKPEPTLEQGLIGIQAETHPTEFARIDLLKLTENESLKRHVVSLSPSGQVAGEAKMIRLLPTSNGDVIGFCDSGRVGKCSIGTHAFEILHDQPETLGDLPSDLDGGLYQEYLVGNLSAARPKFEISANLDHSTKALLIKNISQITRDRFGGLLYVDGGTGRIVRDVGGEVTEIKHGQE